MDARIDPQRARGLALGAAHVFRNAGAVVSDDVLRSLVLSQRLLGTHSVAVMAHTDCGLRKVHDEDLARLLEAETGQAPPFAFGAFFDLDEHVREQMERVGPARGFRMSTMCAVTSSISPMGPFDLSSNSPRHVAHIGVVGDRQTGLRSEERSFRLSRLIATTGWSAWPRNPTRCSSRSTYPSSRDLRMASVKLRRRCSIDFPIARSV